MPFARPRQFRASFGPSGSIDAGWSLVNPIPVSVCRALGAHVVVAVNLNGDRFGRGATLVHDDSEDSDVAIEESEDEDQPLVAVAARRSYYCIASSSARAAKRHRGFRRSSSTPSASFMTASLGRG